MNTTKFLQLFVLLSVLLASFASTSSAFAAPASAGQCGTSVTVVSGDTLRKIADRCGTSVAALRLANPEIGWGNLIYPNQVFSSRAPFFMVIMATIRMWSFAAIR